ncbi:hypothetical protein FEM48_Zijuj06G0179900 [Ziziphus jujuba var. spinosa]|uniref:Protein NRT1/ PTR FAMILY 1.2-like n=1 Tax=Ziziphus jujuba var. spinosa TaxID=714518 RepID=A0A978VAS6_ZIZJJ|nr:hypothetical protein FEM48_Zijuj06G0179900 [Ziziphus jujuba var. spinosa]
MVISSHSTTNESIETPLLNHDTTECSPDGKGHLPVPKLQLSAGGEVAERVAYKGVGCNLVNFLTGPMGQSMAMAVENVNAWLGAANLMPLIGAFAGDSLLGRYWTILVSSLLSILVFHSFLSIYFFFYNCFNL